jgi:predicted nucleic acid-binding protein
VLDEAAAGNIEIVVSALALVEILYVRGVPQIKKDQSAKIVQFFRQPYFIVVNVDDRIARLARDVVWDHGVEPRDAVHVATALAAQAAYLDTGDAGLLKMSGKVGGSPTLSICTPGYGLQRSLDLQPKGKR